MSAENKITEVFQDATRDQIDSHMEKMNKDGFELMYVQDIPEKDTAVAVYRLFWRRAWQQ